MREIPGGSSGSLNTRARKRVAFQIAVTAIAARVRALRVNLRGTPMPALKAQTAAVFNRVASGSVEVVTRGRQQFVVLGLDQVLALIPNAGRRRTVAEVFAGLPTVPPSIPRLRFTSVAAPSPYRLRDEARGT
uniref:Uncharacterized protein n=1 Tax=Ralstonia solanacearum TaxID=305 RepID=A0A0S4WE19_RALSL|nr:conserved protein of unknown function [Ralstonia solanacearum]